MSTPGKHFTVAQRALHWLMAACILAMLFIGIGMVSTVAPDYVDLVAIHKTLGATILVLALARLALRLKRGAPPLPADLPPVIKAGALLSHVALYALMIVLPLTGWAMLSAADYPVIAFGLHLPRIVAPDAGLHATLWTAHQFLALSFFALIVLHLAAGLFHALVRHDGVFEAMSPVGRDR